jgi:hypothetical protein
VAPPTTTKPQKKKKSGGWRNYSVMKIGKDFLKGGQEAARGLPTGIKVNAKALAALSQGDPRPLAKMGKQMARQTATDVRHPLRDPFSTFLTALAVSSMGAGSAARVGAAGKALGKTGSMRQALKAGKQKPVYKRSFAGTPSKPGRIPPRYTLEANRNPLARLGRKATLDPLYRASKSRGEKSMKARFDSDVKPLRVEGQKKSKAIRDLSKKIQAGRVPDKAAARKDLTKLRGDLRKHLELVAKTEKEIASTGPGRIARGVEAREKFTRARFEKQGKSATPEGPAPPKFKLKDSPKNIKKSLGEADIVDLWNAPMNAVRMGMTTRPRYFAQNLPQTVAMLLAEQGPVGLARSVGTARKLRKTDPDLPKKARAAGGDPGQGSVAQGAGGFGSVATKRLAHYANAPEARLRELGIYGSARDLGMSKADLMKALEHPKSQQYQMMSRRSADVVGDYNRAGGPGKLGKAEAKFMKSGIPIFYPMWKALARYGAQFPTKHPIQASILNQLGQEGFDRQEEDFGGLLPPWSPYLMKTGEDETVNPQNIHPFSPFADITEAALSPLTPGGANPTRNLGQYVGPAPELLWALQSGQQLQTGWPIKGVDDGEIPLTATLKDFLPTLPGFDLAAMAGLMEPRTTEAYGTPSAEEQFWMWLLGPAYHERKTNMRVLKKQGKQQKR